MSSWLLINVLNDAQKFLSWNLWFKVAVLEKKKNLGQIPFIDLKTLVLAIQCVICPHFWKANEISNM